MYFFATKAVKKIVDSKDNIIDQLKELRKHSYMKGVRRFIDRVVNANMSRRDNDSKYILYCVVKYYYQLDVVKISKLEQPHPDIKLYAYIKEKPIIEEPVDNFTPLQDVKKNDKIKILNGPFKDLIGLIVKTNLDNDEFTVHLDILGQESIIDLDTQNNKFIKIDDTDEL